jgi:hypothetical protein
MQTVRLSRCCCAEGAGCSVLTLSERPSQAAELRATLASNWKPRMELGAFHQSYPRISGASRQRKTVKEVAGRLIHAGTT